VLMLVCWVLVFRLIVLLHCLRLSLDPPIIFLDIGIFVVDCCVTRCLGMSLSLDPPIPGGGVECLFQVGF